MASFKRKEDVENGDEGKDDFISIPLGAKLTTASSRRQSVSDSIRNSSIRLSSSLSRSTGYGLFGGSNPLESAQAMGSTRQDDEEDLKWAALEKLPTYDRLRTSVLKKPGTGSMRQVRVKDLSTTDFDNLLQKIYYNTDDEDHLLSRVRKRLDK